MVKQMDKYLRWETEASVHHLFTTLESAQKPLRKYFGRGWPRTVLFYRKNHVIWTNKWSEVHALGQAAIDLYSDKEKEKRLWKDWEKENKRLEEFFKKIDKLDLKKRSDSELLKLYEDFRKSYINWWVFGWLDEPVAIQGERVLKKKAELTNNEITGLLASTWRSFLSEIEEDLLKIIRVYRRDKKQAQRLIKNHSMKYFWKQNSYLKSVNLGSEMVRDEVKKMDEKIRDVQKEQKRLENQPKESKEKKEKLLEKLSPELRRVAELVDSFGFHQDKRKKRMMMAAHYIDKFLEEFGDRVNIDLVDMRYILPSEIKKSLSNRAIAGELKKRQEACAIEWDEKDKVSVFYGKDLLSLEKKVFGKVDIAKINEISGWGASTGTVVGKVRVLRSPKDASKLKEGEVLVASMTSPDYIIAIKKAAAIVTDWGGVTSHAAIVSREFGIPCIVGTDIATKVLKDGDTVEIIADEGIVRKMRES